MFQRSSVQCENGFLRIFPKDHWINKDEDFLSNIYANFYGYFFNEYPAQYKLGFLQIILNNHLTNKYVILGPHLANKQELIKEYFTKSISSMGK